MSWHQIGAHHRTVAEQSESDSSDSLSSISSVRTNPDYLPDIEEQWGVELFSTFEDSYIGGRHSEPTLNMADETQKQQGATGGEERVPQTTAYSDQDIQQRYIQWRGISSEEDRNAFLRSQSDSMKYRLRQVHIQRMHQIRQEEIAEEDKRQRLNMEFQFQGELERHLPVQDTPGRGRGRGTTSTPLSRSPLIETKYRSACSACEDSFSETGR